MPRKSKIWSHRRMRSSPCFSTCFCRLTVICLMFWFVTTYYDFSFPNFGIHFRCCKLSKKLTVYMHIVCDLLQKSLMTQHFALLRQAEICIQCSNSWSAYLSMYPCFDVFRLRVKVNQPNESIPYARNPILRDYRPSFSSLQTTLWAGVCCPVDPSNLVVNALVDQNAVVRQEIHLPVL